MRVSGELRGGIVKLHFSKPTPSANKLRGGFGPGRFHAYAAMRNSYRKQIRSQLMKAGVKTFWDRCDRKRKEKKELGGEGEWPELRYLVVTRHSSRSLDYDNFIGGCKPLLDALVREGLLFDDSPQWLEAEYRQEKCARIDARTEVEVTS